MRCLACQIDLHETIAICPLCGSAAENIAPLIPGVPYQDYPDCKNKHAASKGKLRQAPLPFMEKLKAVLHF